MRRFASSAVSAKLLSPSVGSVGSQGVPGLFSSATTDDLWQNQVSSLVDDLEFSIKESINGNLAKIASEKAPAVDLYHKLMQQTALDPRDSLVFNSASALYNLTLFFSSLKHNVSNDVTHAPRASLLHTQDYTGIVGVPPADTVLLEKIVKSFGSYEEFVTLFMASAMALQGNGTTWLVLRSVEGNTSSSSSSDAFKNNAALAVVNTYNNGTPTTLTKGQISAVSSHMAAAAGGATGVVYKARESSDKILTAQEAQSVEPFEFIGVPLFGVPSNPAFFLRDYGVFGKNAYLQNALRCIDWDVVSARFKSLITSEKRK